MNYYLKNFFKFRANSLSGRISFLFISAGILIFLLSSFFSVKSSVDSFVNLTGSYISSRIYQENKDYGGDLLFNNIGKNSQSLKKVSEFINSLYLDFASDYSSISEISFYMRDERQLWDKIYFNTEHILKSIPSENNSDYTNRINQTFYTHDSVTKYTDLTQPTDKYSYLLKTKAKIQYRKILKANGINLLVNFILLIVISRLFALKVSNLILNKSSSIINQLESIKDNNMDIDDDDDPVEELFHISTTIKAMRDSLNNRFNSLKGELYSIYRDQNINNKVLKAGSSQELLLNIKKLVEEKFPVHSVGIILRTSFDNGFMIYSERFNKTSFLKRNNFFMDNDISSENRELLKTEFDITNECDDPQLLNLLSSVSGNSFGSITAKPFSKDGEFIGSLFVSRISKEGFSDEEKEFLDYISKWICEAIRKFRSVYERVELLTSVIITFSGLSEGDPESLKSHSLNVARSAEAMGVKLDMEENEIVDLMIAALLHDIGKISMNGESRDKHPEKSVDLVFSHFPVDSIREGILHHHEKWDGTGFPDGLKAEEIPLFARIISIADFYENSINLKKWSPKKTFSFMLGKKGISFSPDLVDIFISLNKN